jgi:hypothetical protein
MAASERRAHHHGNPALKETALVLEKATRYAGIENGHLLVGPIAIEARCRGFD